MPSLWVLALVADDLVTARAGDVAFVELLLEGGALVDLPSKEGTTPLMAAAGVDFGSRVTRGRNRTDEDVIETMRVLLEHGADIDAQVARQLTGQVLGRLVGEHPLLLALAQPVQLVVGPDPGHGIAVGTVLELDAGHLAVEQGVGVAGHPHADRGAQRGAVQLGRGAAPGGERQLALRRRGQPRRHPHRDQPPQQLLGQLAAVDGDVDRGDHAGQPGHTGCHGCCHGWVPVRCWLGRPGGTVSTVPEGTLSGSLIRLCSASSRHMNGLPSASVLSRSNRTPE